MIKGYIYKVSNTINNKLYIGQTSRSIEERWKEHCTNCNKDNNLEYKNKFHRALRKYGIDKFKVEMQISISAKTESQLKFVLNFFETYYITIYDSFQNGYNSSWGGDYNPLWGITGKDHPSSVKVNQYNLDGKFIKTWDSMNDIEREFDKDVVATISKVCQYKKYHKNVSSLGFIWRYYSEFSDCNDLDENTVNRVKEVRNSKNSGQFPSKKVEQYDLEGNYIKTFDSVLEAAKSCSGFPSGITVVCTGKKPTYKGYIWKHA